jgi:hypothetical protein
VVTLLPTPALVAGLEAIAAVHLTAPNALLSEVQPLLTGGILYTAHCLHTLLLAFFVHKLHVTLNFTKAAFC